MLEISFKRIGSGDATEWQVFCAEHFIGQVKRTGSFGRGYSKSQMCTRHIVVWRGSVRNVDALTAAQRGQIERELKKRDKVTREKAAEYMVAAYRAAGVPLPHETADLKSAA